MSCKQPLFWTEVGNGLFLLENKQVAAGISLQKHSKIRNFYLIKLMFMGAIVK